MRSTHRLGITLAAALAALHAGGCIAPNARAPRVTRAVTNSTEFSRGAVFEKINADELDQLTNAYADRYRTLVEDAIEDILRDNANPAQRAAAQRMLVGSTSSMYDIATNGDPFTQVLDMTVTVTLTSQVWIDRDRATREFGEARGASLVTALRRAREEIWDIAARVFTADQLSALDFLIASWSKQNAAVEDVYFVRFNDFSESRGQSIVTEVAGGGGLFEPIGRAVDQAKSYERLIERMFYLSKRAPILLSWQSEAVVDDVLAKPEIGGALGNLDAVTKSVDDLSKTADRLTTEIPELLAREREQIFAEIDKRQQAVDGTLGHVRTLVDAAAPIVKDVNTLAATSERILGKVAEIKGPPTPPDPNAPPAKPFDVDDYNRLLAQASVTLREANTLAASGESLAKSPAIKGLIDEVTRATQERIDSVEEASQRIIWQLGAALSAVAVVVFALALAYREIGRRRTPGAGA